MIIFFITFSVFLLAMTGLALGWIIDQKVLKGSCGGLNNVPGMEGASCSCSNPCDKRKKREAEARQRHEQSISFIKTD